MSQARLGIRPGIVRPKARRRTYPPLPFSFLLRSRMAVPEAKVNNLDCRIPLADSSSRRPIAHSCNLMRDEVSVGSNFEQLMPEMSAPVVTR